MGENNILETQKILKTFLEEIFGNIFKNVPDPILDIGEPYEQYKHSKDAIIKLKKELLIIEALKKLIQSRIDVNKIFDELWETVNEPIQSIKNITNYWNKKFLDLDRALKNYSILIQNFNELKTEIINILESTESGRKRVKLFKELTKFDNKIENSIVGALSDCILKNRCDKGYDIINKIKNNIKNLK